MSETLNRKIALLAQQFTYFLSGYVPLGLDDAVNWTSRLYITAGYFMGVNFTLNA